MKNNKIKIIIFLFALGFLLLSLYVRINQKKGNNNPQNKIHSYIKLKDRSTEEEKVRVKKTPSKKNNKVESTHILQKKYLAEMKLLSQEMIKKHCTPIYKAFTENPDFVDPNADMFKSKEKAEKVFNELFGHYFMGINDYLREFLHKVHEDEKYSDFNSFLLTGTDLPEFGCDLGDFFSLLSTYKEVMANSPDKKKIFSEKYSEIISLMVATIMTPSEALLTIHVIESSGDLYPLSLAQKKSLLEIKAKAQDNWNQIQMETNGLKLILEKERYDLYYYQVNLRQDELLDFMEMVEDATPYKDRRD